MSNTIDKLLFGGVGKWVARILMLATILAIPLGVWRTGQMEYEARHSTNYVCGTVNLHGAIAKARDGSLKITIDDKYDITDTIPPKDLVAKFGKYCDGG
ncbi:MAG: hypothetical protein PHT88_00735 [Candidatus Moranbacteria bacterium]|nr:hypothetical protein [Candidatus Moranbacteria bacterium]